MTYVWPAGVCLPKAENEDDCAAAGALPTGEKGVAAARFVTADTDIVVNGFKHLDLSGSRKCTITGQLKKNLCNLS